MIKASSSASSVGDFFRPSIDILLQSHELLNLVFHYGRTQNLLKGLPETLQLRHPYMLDQMFVDLANQSLLRNY